ncbi:tRNA-specific adenosine deaminase 1 [Rhodotorula toruloides]|nr:tRNA-specific adenosine deaminase 1 [Rhodotorula toruloides]
MGDTAHAQLHEVVTRAALSCYAALPANGKPRRRSSNHPEWTVLAAVVLYRDEQARCVSIGTGLKALPHARLPVHGDVLHDSHAEVVARRGFKRWMYRQIEREIELERGKGKEREGAGGDGKERRYFERTARGSWALRSEWQVAMYISTLPCGDASTFFLSLSAPSDAPAAPEVPQTSSSVVAETLPSSVTPATPHQALVEAASLGLHTSRSSPTCPSTSSAPATPPTVHRGRVAYSALSILRTKPGRADSPPTTSHSCSDKLALWALLGMQGGLLSALGDGVEKVKLSLVVVGGIKEELREKVGEEVRRAIGGRLEDWARRSGLDEGEFSVPKAAFTDRDFEHSREVVAAKEGCELTDVLSCGESLSFVADLPSSLPAVEVINNGIRQGASNKRKPGEPLDAKRRSRLSKLSLFETQSALQAQLDSTKPPPSLTYFQAKHSAPPSSPAARYQRLKSLVRSADGPFAGWLVSGQPWESFDAQGRLSSRSDEQEVAGI